MRSACTGTGAIHERDVLHSMGRDTQDNNPFHTIVGFESLLDLEYKDVVAENISIEELTRDVLMKRQGFGDHLALSGAETY